MKNQKITIARHCTLEKPGKDFVKEVSFLTGFSESHVYNVLAGRVTNNKEIEDAALKVLKRQTKVTKPEEKKKSNFKLTKEQREKISKKTGFSDSYIYQISTGRRKNKVVFDLIQFEKTKISTIPIDKIINEISSRTGLKHSYIENILTGKENNLAILLMAESIDPKFKVEKPISKESKIDWTTLEHLVDPTIILKGVKDFSNLLETFETVIKNINRHYTGIETITSKDISLIKAGYILCKTNEILHKALKPF